MILFFVSALVVSIVGMIVLIVLKRWELSTGHVVGGRVRPALGAMAHHALGWIEYKAPALVRGLMQTVWAIVRRTTHRLVALVVLVTENVLERLLKLLRHNTQVPRSETQASSFLREVSAHKRQLVKKVKKRSLYEE